MNTDALHEKPARTGWRDALRNPAMRLRAIDILAAMAAAALPWSTTASTVFIVLCLGILIYTIEWREFVRGLSRPSCALPLALPALAVIGILWSDGTWMASLRGIKPVLKLLAIPFLLYHFQRSQHGMWVFIAFLASCTVLMIFSWIGLFIPEFKVAHTVSVGVPVRNYIDQSQEFALCAFALALPALIAFRWRKRTWAIGCLVLLLAFLANMSFVISARTALLYVPVLLLMFAVLHLNRRAALALLAASAVAAVLVWSTSPNLRKRVADIAVEYHAYSGNTLGSTAERLEYWRKSVKFIAEAPVFGHGTGSIRQLFEREAVGQTGLSAMVVSNPHNQTLNVAVQWGLVGTIVLYGMWLSHLLLFRGAGIAAWIGLVVVVQNFVSSLLNSHLFDFTEGWIYVLGVGVAGGMAARRATRDKARRESRTAVPGTSDVAVR
ncbi:MAG: O-antigen ligase family protein [Pseudomonadota bacterium]